jgi:Ca2+:H+ antiporter
VRVYSTMMFIAVMSLALPSIYERAFAANEATVAQDKINVGLAGLLIALYGLYLLYMIRTHPEEFASVGEQEPEHEAEAHWSLPLCIGVLVGASVVAAVLSEILVGAVEGTGEALGLSQAFLGIVLLASVGGAAEGISAVILIALFVAPLLVFASYFVGPQPFLLSFNMGSVALLFLSVLIGALVATGGTGNWYKGVQLIAVYLMIALLLYFVPL